jgi:hypothetical protein
MANPDFGCSIGTGEMAIEKPLTPLTISLDLTDAHDLAFAAARHLSPNG